MRRVRRSLRECGGGRKKGKRKGRGRGSVQARREGKEGCMQENVDDVYAYKDK